MSAMQHTPTIFRGAAPRGVGGGRRAFTLIELMIVIAIAVLLMALAVPVFRTLTGTRSVEAGTNVLSATLNRVRMEAIGFQQYRGVMFYLDQNTGRVGMITVAETATPTGAVNLGATADVWFDVVGDAEGVLLPNGVGVEGHLSIASSPGNAYIGFNPSYNLATGLPILPTVNRYGYILAFTPDGRLFLGTPGTVWWTGTAPTNTSNFLFGPGQTLAGLQGLFGSSQFFPLMAVSLFDTDEFLSQFPFGGSDAWRDDLMMGANEQNKEIWLNNNSTPFLLNRYNGTLIKGE